MGPTRLFQVSRRIALIIFVLFVTSLFVPIPFFKGNVITVFGALGFACILLVVFCKKFNDIGTIDFHEERIEIDYQNGIKQNFKIGLLTLLKVEVVSYWGGRVGLSIMPHHGCSNSIQITDRDRTVFHYFRIESREERDKAFRFMKKWTEDNGNVRVIKGLF